MRIPLPPRNLLLLVLLPLVALIIALVPGSLRRSSHVPTKAETTAAPSSPSNSSPSPFSMSSSPFSSPYLRLADIEGKGRGFIAATPIPAGAFLFTERPLSSSPFHATSAHDLTPQHVVDELALILLQDPQGAYDRLCHHVADRPGEGGAAAALRSSPSPLYSDLQFSTAVSQVQSNAFAAELTAEEEREWKERKEAESGEAASTRPQEEKESGEKKKRKRKKKKGQAKGDSASTSSSPSASPSADGGSGGALRVLTLYVDVSMLNHCCHPNAAVHWGGGGDDSFPSSSTSSTPSLPRVYSLAPIDEGDEVCIAYRADLLHYPTPLRRSLIAQSWHFDCACERCTRPDDFPQEQRLLSLTRRLSEEEGQQMLADFASLTAYAERLQRGEVEPPLHPAMQRRLLAFFDLPLAVSHWRLHRLRALFLPHLLSSASLPYEQKRRWLEDHIASNRLVLPALHPSKLKFFLTFHSLVGMEEADGKAAARMEAVDAQLVALDPDAVQVLRMYNASQRVR